MYINNHTILLVSKLDNTLTKQGQPQSIHVVYRINKIKVEIKPTTQGIKGLGVLREYTLINLQ